MHLVQGVVVMMALQARYSAAFELLGWLAEDPNPDRCRTHAAWKRRGVGSGGVDSRGGGGGRHVRSRLGGGALQPCG